MLPANPLHTQRLHVIPFIMRPDSATYRFTILYFNCLLTFGSYFCFDVRIPSPVCVHDA